MAYSPEALALIARREEEIEKLKQTVHVLNNALTLTSQGNAKLKGELEMEKRQRRMLAGLLARREKLSDYATAKQT